MADTARITVDGRDLEVAAAEPLLQAMLDAGLNVPHYCYHPKLSIDGSCRLCAVKIEGTPKLQISCNTAVRDGMVVHTRDPEVEQTRRGVLELLLLNHPLDCPICDKAGECWLQNYSMEFGSRLARTIDPRRKHGKRLDIGERMLLDQERCILCRRCVRFCREVSKTGELMIFGRGDRSVLDIGERRLDNPYSMCTADICPVGALETKEFHHRLRVWFFTETASVCPGCAAGCNIMVDENRNRAWRLMPRRNDAVNATWMCDEGRLTHRVIDDPGRLRAPLILDQGTARRATWDEAVERTAAAITELRGRHGDGALGAVLSPHLTVEENFRMDELLRAAGVATVAMAVARGSADDFLIKAEKAPNARGVRELGLVAGSDDGLERLLAAVESGRLRGLYVCGDDLVRVAGGDRTARALDRLDLLVVQTLRPVAEFARATVSFPATAFAEKEGVFVNHAGRAQRILAAIEPPPGWLCDGEIFTRLLNRLTSGHERFSAAEVWAHLTQANPRFAGLTLERLGTLGAPLAGLAEAQAAREQAGMQ